MIRVSSFAALTAATAAADLEGCNGAIVAFAGIAKCDGCGATRKAPARLQNV